MINESDRDAGTKTSSTAMSWLPVPRRPETVQVSMMRASVAGNSMSRESGMPLGSRRGAPFSTTTLPPISQAQCSQPLANGQRPVTRYPPSTAFARPEGAKTPPVTTSWRSP